MLGIFQNLRAILEEGRAAGVFRPVNPVVTYFSIIGPMMFFRAAAPVRELVSRLDIEESFRMDTAAFADHLKVAALQTLAPSVGAPANAAKPRPARARGKGRAAKTGDRT